MDKSERRNKLRGLVKQLYKSCRAVDLKVLELTLLTFALNDKFKKHTVRECGVDIARKFRQDKHFVTDTFKKWKISLEGDTFTEPEKDVAEFAIVCILQDNFGDIVKANGDWLNDTLEFTVQTPHGNYHKKLVFRLDDDNKPAIERLFVPADKAISFFHEFYPKCSEAEIAEELSWYAANFCTDKGLFFDFEDLRNYNRITAAEYYRPYYFSTADEMDEKFLYAANLFGIKIVKE